MKKNILIAVLVVVVGVVGFLYLRDNFSGGQPVAPNALKPGATEFGTLKVVVLASGQPLSGVEVDLGTMGTSGPTGPMSAVLTNADGEALFERVPVDTYDIFWNLNAFPKGYQQQPSISVTIVKDRTVTETVSLTRGK